MTQFTSKEFLGETMTQIIQFRQTGALCDVTLTVGQDQIKAHRCVLAARSDYFRALFLGQYKDTTRENIDLSEVTTDIKALEQVVDFIYTGKIEINDDNLQDLMKLSTFFFIKTLRENCSDYMTEEHVDLRTCLNRYFYSVEYSLDEVEQRKRFVIMSRFHDYFIHEDTLGLSPSELQLLLNKGMFQFCTAMSILQFMYRWIADKADEATDQHFSVATQILDTIEEQRFDSLSELQNSKINEMVVKIGENLNQKGSSVVQLFLEKVQKYLTENVSNLEKGSRSNSCQLKPEPSSANMVSPSSDYEEVIMTLSAKQCVVENFNETIRHMNKPTRSFTEPTFTLCCYLPSTKTWYHVDDLQTGDAVAYLPKCYGQSCTVITTLYKEELVLICGDSCEKVHFYHLRNRSWRTVTLPNFREESWFQHIEIINYCATEGNNCLYLIVKLLAETFRYGVPDGEFFIGLRLSQDGRAERIFETSKQGRRFRHCSELHATVSEVSNELIFTCGPLTLNDKYGGWNYAFIVDLNEDKPTAVNLFQKHIQRREKGLTGVQILQTHSHFYILFDGTTKSTKGGEVCIIYKYKFHSKVLTKLQKNTNQQDDETSMSDEETYLHDVETEILAGINQTGEETKAEDKSETGLRIYHHEGREEQMIPCCEEFTVSNKNTIWSFEGDRYFFSALHEVTVEDERVRHKEHIPPPFSSVTLMAVGELPADLVSRLAETPVRKFLDNAAAYQ